MKYIAATEFKAKCLKVMEDVAATGEPVTVTKHGRPVARVLPPIPEEPPKRGWGAGAGTLKISGDIVGPMDTTDWTLDGVPWEELFPEADGASPAPEEGAEPPPSDEPQR